MATAENLTTLYTRNVDVNIAYRKEGDWAKANMLLNDLPYLVKKAVKEGQKKFADKYLAALHKRIANEGGGIWAPLSKHYARFKAREGGGSDIMYWYGEYLNAIKINFTDKGITVGIDKTVRHSRLNPSRNITIAQYAKTLEHGSFWHNIPARPLWAPSFKDAGGKQGVLKTVTQGISQKLLKKYGIYITIK